MAAQRWGAGDAFVALHYPARGRASLRYDSERARSRSSPVVATRHPPQRGVAPRSLRRARRAAMDRMATCRSLVPLPPHEGVAHDQPAAAPATRPDPTPLRRATHRASERLPHARQSRPSQLLSPGRKGRRHLHPGRPKPRPLRILPRARRRGMRPLSQGHARPRGCPLAFGDLGRPLGIRRDRRLRARCTSLVERKPRGWTDTRPKGNASAGAAKCCTPACAAFPEQLAPCSRTRFS